MVTIPRNLSKDLKIRLEKSPAVAILGPRQVGKTTLVKQLDKSCIYLDLENPRDLAKLNDAYSYLESFENQTVIIDEVQLMPELFSYLRPLIDANRKPGRFVLLGSAAPNLIKGVSETLAGRINYLELTSIGLTETKEDQAIHWFRGGFPTALLAEDNSETQSWIGNFVKSYIERDLAVIFGVTLSQILIRNFWSMLAHNNGNLYNGENFARSLGVTNPTINRYLDFLEGAYLVRRLNPWLVNAKKRLIKSPKTYIRDSGVLHYLLNISSYDQLFGHPGVGASWEGYVVEQIFQNKPQHLEIFFYRTQTGAECDLLLVEGITPIACIEIKLSNAPTLSRGFNNCVADLQPKHQFIITPNSETYPYSKSITVINLFNFLEEKLKSL